MLLWLSRDGALMTLTQQEMKRRERELCGISCNAEADDHVEACEQLRDAHEKIRILRKQLDKLAEHLQSRHGCDLGTTRDDPEPDYGL